MFILQKCRFLSLVLEHSQRKKSMICYEMKEVYFPPIEDTNNKYISQVIF